LLLARLGEETGLWGATLVVALFAVILWCGLQITKNARDAFGRFLAAGCTSLIALQASINIAVDISLVPNKGLPLPFVSYGGSSLLAMFIGAGLLGSVAWHSSHGQDWLQTPTSRPVPIQLMLF
jgi:cell division protein FtsW